MNTATGPSDAAFNRQEENAFQEVAIINFIRLHMVVSFFIFLIAARVIAGVKISIGIIVILAFWSLLSIVQAYWISSVNSLNGKRYFNYLTGFFEMIMILAIIYLSADIHWISPIVLGFPILYTNFIFDRSRALVITLIIAASFSAMVFAQYVGIIPVWKLFGTQPVFFGDLKFTLTSVIMVDMFLLFLTYAAGSFADLYRRQNDYARKNEDKLNYLNLQLIDSEQASLHLNESLESNILAKTEELRDRNLELEILNGIAIGLGKSLEIDTILSDTLNRLVKIFPLSLCEISVYDDIDANITFYVRSNTVARVTRATAACQMSRKYSNDLTRSGVPLVVDISASIPHSRLLTSDTERVDDLAIFPINSKNRVVGSLAVTSAKNNFLNNRDLGLLIAISNMIGSAIENGRLFEHLQNVSDTDSVTGLFNERYITRRLDSEFSRAARYRRSLSLMIITTDILTDSDNIGRYSDVSVLRRISLALVSACRLTDIIGRYGDNQFLVILPETGSEEGLMIRKRVLRGISLLRLGEVDKKSKEAFFTINIGLSSYPESGDTLLDILNAADNDRLAGKDESDGFRLAETAG